MLKLQCFPICSISNYFIVLALSYLKILIYNINLLLYIKLAMYTFFTYQSSYVLVFVHCHNLIFISKTQLKCISLIDNQLLQSIKNYCHQIFQFIKFPELAEIHFQVSMKQIFSFIAMAKPYMIFCCYAAFCNTEFHSNKLYISNKCITVDRFLDDLIQNCNI